MFIHSAAAAAISMRMQAMNVIHCIVSGSVFYNCSHFGLFYRVQIRNSSTGSICILDLFFSLFLL